MANPGNIAAVIRRFKWAKTEVTNDQILEIAGGTPKQWFDHLKGACCQIIVRAANIILSEQNLEIISCGIGSLRWRMVSCAEARVDQAHQQTQKATHHLRNAEENMQMVVRDERAHKRTRNDARAWLELFHDEKSEQNLLTFEEWSDELLARLPGHDDEETGS